MKSPMNSLRNPPGTPTTSLPFQLAAAGSRRSQRAFASSAIAPVICKPGNVRPGSIAVRNGASGDTAWASVRGVNAFGGKTGRELSGGVVASLRGVRSVLSRHERSVTIPVSAFVIAAQSAAADDESARVKRTAASRARTKDRLAILHGGPPPAQDTAPASSGKSSKRKKATAP